jgi:hypothetical protein
VELVRQLRAAAGEEEADSESSKSFPLSEASAGSSHYSKPPPSLEEVGAQSVLTYITAQSRGVQM